MNKRQKAKRAGFDSYDEMMLARGPLKKAEYHPPSIAYTIPETHHKYQTDFKIGCLYIELKGRFRNRQEMEKYKYIKKSLEENGCYFLFIFINPDLPLPGYKKRKDGTKRSHKEFAESIGADWIDIKDVEEYVSRTLEIT